VSGPSCNPRLPPSDSQQTQQQGEGGAGQPQQGGGGGAENGAVQFSERDLDFIRKFTEVRVRACVWEGGALAALS
jgi:hypothetical protein